MHTSLYWLQYFSHNLTVKRIDWNTSPQLTKQEREIILKPLQAWQLGETSDGKLLLQATAKYAATVRDEHNYPAMQLFIKEEQKHGSNMGRYLDMIGEKRIKKNWADTAFRKVRGFNTSMEFWTMAVITIEGGAQIFYQSLKDATNCPLLKQICTDILIDEARHIEFQQERLLIMFNRKRRLMQNIAYNFYTIFYFATMLVIWVTYRRLFITGGNGFKKYYKKTKFKYRKTIGRLGEKGNAVFA